MATKMPIVALVDDDNIFQITASKTIAATNLTHKILQFTNGEEALFYIKHNLTDANSLPDYIFLDINMPILDGWMFLKEYEHIKSSLAKPIAIYMISSSIDPKDIEKAKRNTNIKKYVIKPVTIEKFKELLQTEGLNV
jgi:two-component system chemotaxis response regulator CheY